MRRSAAYVRLVEMGFASALAEAALGEVMRIRKLQPEELAIVTRDSRAVNGALDMLLEWGCVPESRELRIFFCIWRDGADEERDAKRDVFPRFSLVVKPNYTIEFLLHRLEEVEPSLVGAEDSTLSFCGTALLPTRTLEDYGIESKRTVTVIIGRGSSVSVASGGGSSSVRSPTATATSAAPLRMLPRRSSSAAFFGGSSRGAAAVAPPPPPYLAARDAFASAAVLKPHRRSFSERLGRGASACPAAGADPSV